MTAASLHYSAFDRQHKECPKAALSVHQQRLPHWQPAQSRGTVAAFAGLPCAAGKMAASKEKRHLVYLFAHLSSARCPAVLPIPASAFN
jgi:hypothetical protein